MSGFQVGDVVQCVADCDCPYHSDMPPETMEAPEMIGKVFRVSSLNPETSASCFALVVTGLQPGPWCAGQFRKIKAADEQFTEQMRALRPVKVSA